jgi:hypothetical protein
MSSIKSALARKAVKTTARHTGRGAASKLKRSPLRTATLLGIGCAVGVLVGWFANRPTAPA